MEMAKNPVLELIEQLGIGYRAFGILYHCPLATLRNTVYGFTDAIPQSVVRSLQEAGLNIDTDTINKLYRSWLKEKFMKKLEVAQDE
jgi:hypothetical protein